jgi:hypothetical protein
LDILEEENPVQVEDTIKLEESSLDDEQSGEGKKAKRFINTHF